MGRPVVLSNGQLFVGLDENGLVHDFYYPYVGLDNLTTARSSQHKVGVWVPDGEGDGGQFSWTNDGSWQVTVDFECGMLASAVTMKSETLGVKLELHDFVDPRQNIFVRRISVYNLRDDEREIRLFMHQVFEISRSGRADTAVYVPEGNYVLDYKGRCCLLIGGKLGGELAADAKVGPDQYAVGNYAIEGKVGTFKDAEDGELSGNAVEHGGVDSVIRFSQTAPAQGCFEVDYWIVAADSQIDGQVIHDQLMAGQMQQRSVAAHEYWRQWLTPLHGRTAMAEEVRRDIERSLLIVKAHCDARGSVLASGDSSIFNFGRDYYCYCWPRDAAYAIWPLLRIGLYGEAKRFFEFARDTMHQDGYLMHKYQPDRSIGSTWHPLVHGKVRELAIQEDETAIVVYMIGEYFKRSKDLALVNDMYDSFIAKAANFMVSFVDEETGLPHASYDLWEEKFLTSSYTVSTVIAGLETAAALAQATGHPDDAQRWQTAAAGMRQNLVVLYHPDGYYRKGYLLQPNGDLKFDDTLDISSLFGPYMFAGLSPDDPTLTSTLKHVEERLLNTTPIGGVIRYEHDNYFLVKRQYKGNPWIVCSLWLAQIYVSSGRSAEAMALLNWTRDRTLFSGALSEQFDPEDGGSLGVTPLVWSHAEYINTLLDASNAQ